MPVIAGLFVALGVLLFCVGLMSDADDSDPTSFDAWED